MTQKQPTKQGNPPQEEPALPENPLPPENPPTNPSLKDVGFCTHLHAGEGLRFAKEMGARWVRVDMPWDVAEPQPQQWNWLPLDQALQQAKRNGLRIMGTLSNTPAWTSSNGKRNGVPNVNDWKRFVRQIVSRYQGDIEVWGIWNEPNLGEFWQGTAEEYVDVLLQPAWQEIKATSSAAKVAGPELAFLGSARIKPASFYATLKNRGVLPLLDIITQHAYGDDPDDFRKTLEGEFVFGVLINQGVKQVLEDVGLLGKPLFISEFGWKSNKVGTDGQARYLTNAVKYLSGLSWVTGVFIYELHDDPNFPAKFGVLDENLTPKQSYFDLQTLLLSIP